MSEIYNALLSIFLFKINVKITNINQGRSQKSSIENE